MTIDGVKESLRFFYSQIQYYTDLYYSDCGHYKSISDFLATVPEYFRGDVKESIELTEIEGKLVEQSCNIGIIKCKIKMRELAEISDNTTKIRDLIVLSDEIDKKFEIIERENAKFNKIVSKCEEKLNILSKI